MRVSTELSVILKVLDEAEDLAHATVELINLFLAGCNRGQAAGYGRKQGASKEAARRIVNVLSRSQEDAGALLSGLLVDEFAVNSSVDTVGTGLLPIAANLQTNGEHWGTLQPLFGPWMGGWTVLAYLANPAVVTLSIMVC